MVAISSIQGNGHIIIDGQIRPGYYIILTKNDGKSKEAKGEIRGLPSEFLHILFGEKCGFLMAEDGEVFDIKLHPIRPLGAIMFTVNALVLGATLADF